MDESIDPLERLSKSDMNVFADAETIQVAIYQMAQEVRHKFLPLGKEIHVVGVMDGCMMLFPALVARLAGFDVHCYFVTSKTYAGRYQFMGPQFIGLGDVLRITRDKNVLLVDDIEDTGETMGALRSGFEVSAAVVASAVLIKKEKSVRTRASFLHEQPEFIGIRMEENHFVVGFGMDYKGHYRQFPDIRMLPFTRD